MKINNLYSDNCIKVLKETIKKNSIDLVFADPPYNLSGNALKWQGNKTIATASNKLNVYKLHTCN